jgi:hypothetical protein
MRAYVESVRGLRMRAYIESVRGSLIQEEFLSFVGFVFLTFSYLFFVTLLGLSLFSYLLLALRLFLLLDDYLKLFWAFGLLVVLHGILDLKFKLCAFLLSMNSSRGRL